MFCTLIFHIDSALAVCRSLGFEYGEYIARDGNTLELDIPVALEEVVCPTNTSGLHRCSAHRWGDYECTSAIRVGVRCCKYLRGLCTLKCPNSIFFIIKLLYFYNLIFKYVHIHN